MAPETVTKLHVKHRNLWELPDPMAALARRVFPLPKYMTVEFQRQTILS